MKNGYAQIVWTIAAKDILDAVKNKATLIFLILTVTMILMNNISFSESAIPEIIIYPSGDSSLVQRLRGSSGMEVDEAGTLQEMQEGLGAKMMLYLDCGSLMVCMICEKRMMRLSLKAMLSIGLGMLKSRD